MVITSCPLPQNEAERLNTLVSLQPEFTPSDGQFSAGANNAALKPVAAPLCGAYAVGLAAGLSWQTVFADARRLFDRSDRWKGRLFFFELISLLTHYGIEHRKIPGMAPLVLEKLAAEIPPDETHIVCITGHFVLLHGGRIFDQHFPLGERISDYPWRRRRIQRWVQISHPAPDNKRG